MNTNNIKVSLTHIAKYIKNKQVDHKDVNNIEGLNNISEMA